MRKYIHIFLAFASAIILILTASCSDSVVTDTGEIEFPDTNVSWSRHVQPFLTLTCAYQGCHSSESRAAGIALDNYFELRNAFSGGLVIEGKPDQSYLMQILQGGLHPYEYIWWPKVNDNHREGIRTWINEGAKNN